MMNHVITIVLFDKDSHVMEHAKEWYIQHTINAVCERDMCATLETEGIYGIYRHEDGTRVIEPSIRVNVAGVSREAILGLVRELRAMFNQESIMLESEEKNISFIDADYEE